MKLSLPDFFKSVLADLMARSHCTGAGEGPGMGLGTMDYNILCRTVHTAPGPGRGPDLLSPIVPVQFPVPVPLPVSCSVNVLY